MLIIILYCFETATARYVEEEDNDFSAISGMLIKFHNLKKFDSFLVFLAETETNVSLKMILSFFYRS